jgi:hypothetical protein
VKTTGYISVFAITLFLLGGCAPKYNPPEPVSGAKKKYTETVNKSFDKTWTSLVSYAGKSFFSIDNFEKESGLMTLNFGATDPSGFIDCGNTEIAIKGYKGTLVNFFITQPNRSIELDGRMNVFVKEIDSNTSKVRVNARYVVTFTNPQKSWNITFDTGGSGKHHGNTVTSECRPTYKAEKALIEAVSES